MRYEAKHGYFKRWAGIMGNFKNIAKSLANHHQKYLCYKLLQDEYLTAPESIGPGTLNIIQSSLCVMTLNCFMYTVTQDHLCMYVNE